MDHFAKIYEKTDAAEFFDEARKQFLNTIHSAMNQFKRETGFFIKGDFGFLPKSKNGVIEADSFVNASFDFTPREYREFR